MPYSGASAARIASGWPMVAISSPLWRVSVSDTGTGMTPDVIAKAFDPFFTTRRDIGRIGLGLHIVHNIVTNRLGGELHLDSAPGMGTRVRITLPLIAPQRGTDS